MKIVIDLTSLYDHLTGIERYALEMSGNMMRQFPEHEYVLFFKNEIYKEFKAGGRYSLRTLSGENNNISYKILKGNNKLIFNQITLLNELRKTKADAYLFLAFPEPVLFNRKSVFTAVHDVSAFDCGENMKFLSKWYFRISNKHTFRNAKRIITISEFSKERIGHYSKKAKEKTDIVYCGVTKTDGEQKKSALDIRIKYNLPEKYLLTLSTIEPRKNLKLLLSAYEMQLEKGVNLPELVLAGRMGWKMEDFLESYSDKLKNKLVFTGFIEDEDLSLVYNMADCFIFPSMYEGFGMPPLEALSYGVSVLSSDAASMPEVLGDAAVYFKSGDVSDLAEKIVELINISDDKKNLLKENGYKRCQMFNWDGEAKKLHNILTDTLE